MVLTAWRSDLGKFITFYLLMLKIEIGLFYVRKKLEIVHCIQRICKLDGAVKFPTDS